MNNAHDDHDHEVARSVRRDLDAERRRLDDIEQALDRALAGDAGPSLSKAAPPGPMSYDELTQANDLLREEQGWGEADIYDSLTPQAQRELQQWRTLGRAGGLSSWSGSDIAVVGLAAVVGTVACVYDTAVDDTVRQGLAALAKTDLVRGWERAAKRMPIDYTGPNFGGPAHRVRSSGHDLGRPLAALQQIRDGAFRGVVWQDGVRTVFTTEAGAYVPIPALGEALTLWLQHLAADFVTPMSLPLPGWTSLYDLPDREVRQLAHMIYTGPTWGEGLNLRSGGLTPQMCVLSTEALVRTHVHLASHRDTGSFVLSPAAARRRDEMLLAAHSVVGAACLANTLAAGFGGEGPLALRHVNVPLLTRVGWLGAKVVRERRAVMRLAPKPWSELLTLEVRPWLLDEAPLVDAAAAGT